MPAYATPEWLEAVASVYRGNPDNQNKHFKGLSMVISFRILAEPNFGLDKDIYFGFHIEDGVLQDDTAFISAEEAKEKSNFIVSAPPERWKKILQKKEGFVANFMTGKVKLDQGSTVKFIPLGAKAPALVDNFYQVETQWPDEMNAEEMESYKAKVKAFREEIGV